MTKNYLGIDVGGSKIIGVVVDAKFKSVSEIFRAETPRSRPALVALLLACVSKIRLRYRLYGIGIGVPGMVDPRSGRLLKAPNLPFLNGWDIWRDFKRFDLPVRVDNDNRCFVRAEWRLGAGRGHQNIVGLGIGTGIGGGIVIDGKMYSGATNTAGEFGHMTIEATSVRSRRPSTLENLGAKKAFLKYGDRNKMIGSGVASIINAFDPEIVILGGGAVAEANILPRAVARFARPLIIPPRAKRTPIIAGKLGPIAQAIGAALLLNPKNRV